CMAGGPCAAGLPGRGSLGKKRFNTPVCWLEPVQTAEKAKPYIFTQDQAVLNRTFFPCFYTLAIKSTYSASVKVMPVRENTPSFPLGNCSLADVIVREMDNTGEDRPLNKLFCLKLCFDAFLKIAYIDKFKFCSVMAEDALEFFLEYFPDLKKKGVHKIEVKGLEFDSWLNVPGWPLYLPDLSAGQSLMKPAEQLSELWAVEGLDMASIMKTNIQAWKTYFLEKIIEKSPLSRGNIEKQEEQYPHIVKSNNAELRLCWAQIIAKNRHQPGYQHVRSFLSCQGKQMYTLPVYHALWNGSEEARSLATDLQCHLTSAPGQCPQLHQEDHRLSAVIRAEHEIQSVV
uniref:Arginyl aminopeptidase (aminopeptidase B) n=1 Tax=Oncorhynchus tshawytscha TaxID=74940 RepID=A0AAZ3P8L0_ONCTS